VSAAARVADLEATRLAYAPSVLVPTVPHDDPSDYLTCSYGFAPCLGFCGVLRQ
jgi:hypothetical protein